MTFLFLITFIFFFIIGKRRCGVGVAVLNDLLYAVGGMQIKCKSVFII